MCYVWIDQQVETLMRNRNPDLALRSACTLVVMIAVVGLSACSKSEDTSDAASAINRQKSSSSQSSADPLLNMSKAVSETTEAQPVELRFEFATAPQVAAPVRLNLNVLGLQDVTSLGMKVSAASGLEVTKGAEATYAALKQGESWSPALEITGKENGLFLLNVDLQLTSESGVRTYKYLVPVAITIPESSSAGTSAGSSGKT